MLAQCEHLTALRALSFWYMPGFAPAALTPLMRSAAFPALRTFQLNDYNLHGLAPTHLDGNGVLTNLAELHLWRCRLGSPQWALVFGDAHGMREPERLGLWECNIGPDEVATIIRCQSIRTLKVLQLYGNKLGPEGAETLANCPLLGNLQELSLQGLGLPHIGDAGTIALARSKTLPMLESLDLRANEITDAGARALLDAKHLKKLRRLDIRYNTGISEAMLAKLRERYEMPP